MKKTAENAYTSGCVMLVITRVSSVVTG